VRIRDELKAAVEANDDLHVLPGSRINFLAFSSDTKDLLAVWSRLRDLGWTLSYATEPLSPTLILWTLPQNDGCAARFAVDLKDAVSGAPAKDGSPAQASHAWNATPYGGVEA
jgi:hypothetical protein